MQLKSELRRTNYRCLRRPPRGSLGEHASGEPLRIIDLGSIAGLHEHNHQLSAYCPRCDAWRVLPLGEWVSQGKGSLRLPIQVRCRGCREVGQLQVRPPVPSRSSTGWITPP